MTAVAVTGRGFLTCLGLKPKDVLAAMKEGRKGLREASDDEKRLGVTAVGEIEKFKFADYYKAAGFKRLMSREASLAIVAAKFALEDAELVPGENVERPKIDLYTGTGASGLDFRHILRMVNASAGEDGFFDEDLFSTIGLKKIHPLLSFRILPNMPPCFLSILHTLQGDNLIFNPWEGNTGQAIVEGFHRILDGHGPVVVGGSDVKTHTQAFVFLNQVGVLPDPDEKEPLGPPGEGAAYLVLESLAAAQERKAPIHSMLLSYSECSDPEAGWGFSTDSQKLTSLIQKAVDKAGVKPQFVMSSKNGFKASDEAEEKAIKEVLGDDVTIYSPKAFLGDTFAAAGAIAMALASEVVKETGQVGLVNCFGNGRERAAFVLGPARGVNK